jgi:PAS domain S-box-containing protein
MKQPGGACLLMETGTSSLPRLRFSLPLDAARLFRARQRIRDYLYQAGVADDVADTIILALEEAMTNAVRHSGSARDLEVRLRFDGADLIADVRDHGKGFPVQQFDPKRLPDVDANGGRGLYLMAQLMDTLELRGDGGLEVRAVKRDVLGGQDGPSASPLARRAPGAQIHRDVRQQTMLDELPEAYAALDWEFRYVYVNERACRMAHKRRDDLIGMRLWDVFPEIIGTDVEERLRGAMELGAPSSCEVFFPALDGWFEQRLYPTASGVSQFTAEITERKRRELERGELYEALREREERYRELVEKANSAIVRWSRDGSITFFNEYAQQLFGWNEEEILGRPLSIVLPEQDSTGADIKGLAQDILERPDAYRTNVNENVCRDGRRIWMSWTNRAVLDDNGDVREILAVGSDITDEIRARGELLESEARYRSLYENVLAGVFETSVDGRLLRANQAMATMLGYETVDALLESVRDAGRDVYAAPEDRDAVLRAAEEKSGSQAEVRIKRPDGSTGWVGLMTRAVRSNTGEVVGYEGSAFDLTERKRLEEELARKEMQERQLAAHAPAAIYEIDFRGPRFVSVNDFMCEYSGYTREELLAMDPFDFLDDAGRALFAERIRKTLAGDMTSDEVHYRFSTKRGDQRVAILNVSPTFEDGQPVGAFVVAYDVTERSRLETERLRQSLILEGVNSILDAALAAGTEEELGQICLRVAEQVTESEFGFIGEIGPDGRLYDIAVSDPGWTAREMADKRGHGRDQSSFRIADLYGRVLSDGEPLLTSQGGTHADSGGIPHGDPPLTSFLGVPLKDGDRTIGMVAMGNRTGGYEQEQLEALQDLAPAIVDGLRRRRSQETLRTVVEQAEMCLVLLDPDFNFLMVNSAYATACGYEPEQMVGLNHFDLYPHEENEAIFRRVRDTGEPAEYSAKPFVFPGQPQRGVTYWDWRLAPVQDSLGQVSTLVFSLVDVTERVRAALLADALNAIHSAIASRLDTGHIMDTALRLAGEALGSDAGNVAIRGQQGWTPIRVWNMPDEFVGERYSAESVPYAEAAVAEQRPVLLEDYAGDPLGHAGLAERFGVSSTAAIPFVRTGGETGCVFFSYFTPHRFTAAEVEFAEKVGTMLSQALDNAALYEAQRRIATTLQEHFIHPLPAIEDLELAAVSIPAGQPELIGGDFHDVHALPDGFVIALIGDVMGKGVAAAGLTETVRSAIRALSLSSPSPDLLLRQTNRLLLREERAQLVTVLAVLLDSESGQGFLASAGHPPAVHLSKEGPRLIEPQYGPPLASFEAKFPATQFALAPGEALVLYTDGLTEARRDGELLGERRLLEALGAAQDRSPQAIAELLRETVLTYAGGELKDDVQILVLRRSEA